MTPRDIHDFQDWFETLHTTERSQVAMMRLEPGAETGEKAESHPHSDQVLLVLEGEVKGDVGAEAVTVAKGQFVVIPAGVKHRFYNQEDKPALTFNVYALPAYPPDTRG